MCVCNRVLIKTVLSLVLAGFVAESAFSENNRPSEEDYAWWRDGRFGIFIHWNPSSILAQGGGSWQRANSNSKAESGYTNSSDFAKLPEVLKDPSVYKDPYYGHDSNVPQVIYDNLFQLFNPEEFNADEWAKIFKDSGAKYIVFTAKHHDGFCMFDSKYTKYNIMNTPFKRDICKELSDACRKEGIEVIWYYSIPDWYDPRFDKANPVEFQKYVLNQIEELSTHYGKIKGFWWDGGNDCQIDGKKVYEVIYKNQPGAIYNGRGGLGLPGISFGSPEQKLGTFDRGNPWESCVTMQGEGWFWNSGKNVMSKNSCIQLLVNAAIGDGNLLLDLGPTEKGTIFEPIKNNYLAIGAWLKKYGESIYGTRGGPYKPGTWGGSTCKGKTVYLHITQVWPDGKLKLPALPAEIKKATLLTGGKVQFKQTEEALWIGVDPKYQVRPDTIVKLEIDQDAFSMQPIESQNTLFVSLDAEITASSYMGGWRGWPGSVGLHAFEVNIPKAQYFGEEAIPTQKPDRKNFKPTDEQKEKYPWISTTRDHIWRYWMAKPDDKTPWIEIDFGKNKSFNRVTILEKFNRIKSYKLYFLDSKGGWKEFWKDGELGSVSLSLPEVIKTQKVRMEILDWYSDDPSQGPGLREFDFWYDK
jgi:alpha-L-fucosidase